MTGSLALNLTWQTTAVIVALLALCGLLAYLDPSSARAIGGAVAALLTGWLVPHPVRRVEAAPTDTTPPEAP